MKLPFGLRLGDLAWLGVVLYELACPPEETLSQALDRRLEKAPLITEAVILYTALHCANRLPPRLDLLHLSTGVLRGLIWRSDQTPDSVIRLESP